MNTHETIEELLFLCNSKLNTPPRGYTYKYNEDSKRAETELRESLEMAVEGD
jgi:hypothetical protein